MKKFEYREILDSDGIGTNDLDKAGNEGWEVIKLEINDRNGRIWYVFMKREIEETAEDWMKQ
jgi:hypothetical protein